MYRSLPLPASDRFVDCAMRSIYVPMNRGRACVFCRSNLLLVLELGEDCVINGVAGVGVAALPVGIR